ncbi:putative salt-induced outer membrane protein YdiY [Duganella sp. 1411]|nr:putative salt-induced outer membrane protein YdiY [Duganella sp. 1411]
MPMKPLLFVPALALSLSCGHAAAVDLDPPYGWSTSAELGAISTSGNTVGTSVTGKIDSKQELPDWSNEYILAGYFKDEQVTNADGEKVRERSAQRYSLSAKAAYKLMQDRDRLFALATHVDDRFGAYLRYSTIGVGYGTQIYQSETKTLDVEIGPGYFRGARSTGETENGMTVRGAADFKWRLSESALFSQMLTVERGTSNIHSQAETALRTKINNTMQLKAAFSVRNDTSVPADKKNTDTQTSVTLVYSF